MNNSSKANPKWITLFLCVLQRICCFLSPEGSGSEWRWRMLYTEHKIHGILTFGIVNEGRKAWAVMCLDSADLYIPFDPVVKDVSTERLTLGWEVWGMQRGLEKEPMIGMQGLGLHVQLSNRQGEKGVGQLEEKGRDLCHRPCMYPHREKQTGNQTEI